MDRVGAGLPRHLADNLLGPAAAQHEGAVHRPVEGTQRGEEVVLTWGGGVRDGRVEDEEREHPVAARGGLPQGRVVAHAKIPSHPHHGDGHG